jgi:hypothetical protein
MKPKAEKIPTIEEVAKEWVVLKSEKLRIEKRAEELKEILEPYLAGQPDQTAEISGFRFKLFEMERETFKLKAAKEKIDGRVLAPYITSSVSTVIRTTWKGGEEEAA